MFQTQKLATVNRSQTIDAILKVDDGDCKNVTKNFMAKIGQYLTRCQLKL